MSRALKRQVQFVIFVAVVAFLANCAGLSKSQSSDTPSAAVCAKCSEAAGLTTSPRQEFPKEKRPHSEKLYEVLVVGGVPIESSKAVKTVRVRDVKCLFDAAEDKTQCEMVSSGGKTIRFANQEAKSLFAILTDFPVPQGETGASTAFIECHLYAYGRHNCQMAIEVDYPGP